MSSAISLTGCEKDGDDGYTALLRYNVTDFRVAGIDARLVAGSTPDLSAGIEVELEAVLLHTGGTPPELEWLDCPTVILADGTPRLDVELDTVNANPDCLGTPRERRLGRGTRISYTFQQPRYSPWPEMGDGGLPYDEAGRPNRPDDGVPFPVEDPVPIEVDDGVVFLRASVGDTVRYGRKIFAGLFDLGRQPTSIDRLTVDGEPRSLTTRAPLVRPPGTRLEVQFDVVGVLENRAVQWFVSGGELTRHGLTYYVEVDSRQGTTGPIPTATAQNTWLLPERENDHELVAVVGGSFAELPFVRIRVEVRR